MVAAAILAAAANAVLVAQHLPKLGAHLALRQEDTGKRIWGKGGSCRSR
jgi:hypothetical protein